MYMYIVSNWDACVRGLGSCGSRYIHVSPYVLASGGFLVEDPASRALLGYVGSDFSSGLSHTNLCSNPSFAA